MKHFTPPYPKRHTEKQSAIQSILQARSDLLSIWSEDSFKFEFMSQKILKQHVFIANDPRIVKEVFVTKHKIYERKSPQMEQALEPLLGDGLFISHGETWASHRQLQMPLFHTKFVQNYSKIMVSTIMETVEEWKKQGDKSTINVLPEMGQLTAEIISRTLFGETLGREKSGEVVTAFAEYQASIKQTPLSSFTNIPSWLDKFSIKSFKALRAAKRIHAVVDEIIDLTAKKENQETLIAHLLSANTQLEENALTREQIRNEVIVLFMAGHETTANSLAWAWYLISQSPEVEQKLHAELDEVLGDRTPEFSDVAKLPYTRAIFDEAVRLYPPVPIISRQASEDDTIRKKHIPKGSLMLVVPWLLHRHKNHWDDPDSFIPERFLAGAERKPNKFAYIPFSAGPRVCPGKNFGLVESVLSIAILAQHFRLTLPEGTLVKHECRLTLRPKGNLPMTLEIR
ncbi:cytochrome P450 [Leucothrix arctica]|uniref:Cytochrome P450 n=1 Tax=Leucothrix arctica TaxID=1481894 RepID=A0A317CDG6_9GAMM|nr:cytochrome P450 [Leucothrix arctica]PWQ96694.1 cytochrome P450 [Leucothrix arctica]